MPTIPKPGILYQACLTTLVTARAKGAICPQCGQPFTSRRNWRFTIDDTARATLYHRSCNRDTHDTPGSPHDTQPTSASQSIIPNED